MIWIIIGILLIIAVIVLGRNSEQRQPLKKEEQQKNDAYEKLLQDRAERRQRAYKELAEIRDVFNQEFTTEDSFEFDVVGIFYRTEKDQEIAKRLYGGEEVKLKHDKNNNYSNHAIKVIADSYHIGFVPDDIAEEMLPYLLKYKYKAIVLLSFTEFDSLKFDDVTKVTIKTYFFDK